MFVKIIKCSDDNYWYKDLINKEFLVYKDDDYHKAYIINNIDGNDTMMGNIFYDDCVEIQETSNPFIPDRKKTTEEILKDEIANLNSELEMTQNALNELLMKDV